MSDIPTIEAPWTDENVAALNRQQNDARFHPYTCGNNSNHILEATKNGWICPVEGCDYTQSWSLQPFTQPLKEREKETAPPPA